MPRALDIEQKAIAVHCSDLKKEFGAQNRGMEGLRHQCFFVFLFVCNLHNLKWLKNLGKDYTEARPGPGLSLSRATASLASSRRRRAGDGLASPPQLRHAEHPHSTWLVGEDVKREM